MTISVQQLINKLNKVDDKEMPVYINNYADNLLEIRWTDIELVEPEEVGREESNENIEVFCISE